jgi:hypothetical protein
MKYKHTIKKIIKKLNGRNIVDNDFNLLEDLLSLADKPKIGCFGENLDLTPEESLERIKKLAKIMGKPKEVCNCPLSDDNGVVHEKWCQFSTLSKEFIPTPLKTEPKEECDQSNKGGTKFYGHYGKWIPTPFKTKPEIEKLDIKNFGYYPLDDSYKIARKINEIISYLSTEDKEGK